jgi:hypothetical protein
VGSVARVKPNRAPQVSVAAPIGTSACNAQQCERHVMVIVWTENMGRTWPINAGPSGMPYLANSRVLPAMIDMMWQPNAGLLVWIPSTVGRAILLCRPGVWKTTPLGKLAWQAATKAGAASAIVTAARAGASLNPVRVSQMEAETSCANVQMENSAVALRLTLAINACGVNQIGVDIRAAGRWHIATILSGELTSYRVVHTYAWRYLVPRQLNATRRVLQDMNVQYGITQANARRCSTTRVDFLTMAFVMNQLAVIVSMALVPEVLIAVIVVLAVRMSERLTRVRMAYLAISLALPSILTLMARRVPTHNGILNLMAPLRTIVARQSAASWMEVPPVQHIPVVVDRARVQQTNYARQPAISATSCATSRMEVQSA